MKTIRLTALIIAVTALALLLGGCDTSSSTSSLSVIGSTSVQPLAQEIADAYSAKNNNIKVDVQGVGSTAGIKAVHEGTADIGMTSRELTKEEVSWQLQSTVIAIDGISVIVNNDNPVQNLSVEQVRKIFKGEIKNWAEVGGTNDPILLVSREAGSGTRTAFEELTKIAVKKDDKEVSLLAADALIADGNGSVKANIAVKRNSIGYMSMGMVGKEVRALTINAVAATDENVKNKTYVFARPFILLVKDSKPDISAFLNFIRSDEGKAIISKNYIVAD